VIVGVIGNTNLKKTAAILNKDEEEIVDFLRDVGRKLAEMGAEIAFVPQGALLELAMAYKENRGPKAIGVIPGADKIWGIEHLKEGLAVIDEEYNCGDWFRQAYTLLSICDILLVTSLGAGTLLELGFLKYLYKFSKTKKRVVVFTNYLREGKLPIEIEYDIKPLVRYVSNVEQMANEIVG
jgi:hypothetical protein